LASLTTKINVVTVRIRGGGQGSESILTFFRVRVRVRVRVGMLMIDMSELKLPGEAKQPPKYGQPIDGVWYVS
jgi:hypothetical protein